MEQHHNNVPFHPPRYQLPQQTQMTPLNIVPQMQLPFPQQVYNSPFGGSNMTRTSYGTTSHSLQCSSTVRMTPSTSVTVTPSFSTLQTSQPRAVDSGVSSTLHDQYSCSSQQRPEYGMCDYPTVGAPLLPPLPLQVSHAYDYSLCLSS